VDARMDPLLEGCSEGVVRVDGDFRVTATNAAGADHLGADRESLVGGDLREAFPESVDATFHETFGDAEPAETSFEEYYPTVDAWLSVRTRPLDEGMAVYLADVTEANHRRDELADRRRDLETLSRINDLIGEVMEALVGAADRGEIERSVCERVTETDLYDVAWIGEHDPGGERLTVRESAGDEADIVDDLTDGPSAELTAVEDGDVVVVDQVATDDRVPEAVRAAAFRRGLQSSVAVPLRYGSTVYGVLGVYAARPDAFSAAERSGFETLGRVAGFAINAARQRNLLLADAVVEVELQVTDDADALVAATAQCGCSATVEGVVPVGEGSLLCYVTVDGATADEFGAALPDDGVRVERVVDDREDGCLLELCADARSPLVTVTERGAGVPSATYESGTGRIVVQMAPEDDVRETVEAVGEAFPDTALLAKRDRSEPVRTEEGFRGEIDDQLTDRQRTALRTAFLADYFESPRGSTAEEVAESLDITSPTFHHHIRAGLDKLLTVYFDDLDS
jgi:predicted DNA binding protein